MITSSGFVSQAQQLNKYGWTWNEMNKNDLMIEGSNG